MRGLLQKIRRSANKFIGHNNKTVNFIICGAQKSGTSALNSYLRKHPEICMANKKEVHFFDNESFFHNNSPDYSAYHSFFNPKASHKLIGEATPIYMYWYDAPRRIWEYNPNMKFIVILRNPIERAYSHWNMQRSKNADYLSFWDAIQNEQERRREALPYQHKAYSYVDRGFYLEQLRRLWAYFPKDHVLILRNEYLRNQPHEALQSVCDFLKVEHFKNIKPKNKHSLPYTSQMSDRERKHLQFIFEHEIRGIERVLSWDCSNWLSTDEELPIKLTER